MSRREVKEFVSPLLQAPLNRLFVPRVPLDFVNDLAECGRVDGLAKPLAFEPTFKFLAMSQLQEAVSMREEGEAADAEEEQRRPRRSLREEKAAKAAAALEDAIAECKGELSRAVLRARLSHVPRC